MKIYLKICETLLHIPTGTCRPVRYRMLSTRVFHIPDLLGPAVWLSREVYGVLRIQEFRTMNLTLNSLNFSYLSAGTWAKIRIEINSRCNWFQVKKINNCKIWLLMIRPALIEDLYNFFFLSFISFPSILSIFFFFFLFHFCLFPFIYFSSSDLTIRYRNQCDEYRSNLHVPSACSIRI